MEKILLADISIAKDALSFKNDQSYLHQIILKQYRNLVFEKINLSRKHLYITDSDLYEKITYEWKNLTDLDKLPDSFLYPEMLFHIFHCDDLLATWNFALLTLKAESAKKSGIFPEYYSDYLWTSNGDYLLKFDRQSCETKMFESFVLNDLLPLDFFSPYCIKVGGHDLQEQPDSRIYEYDYEHAYKIYEKIYDCLDLLSEVIDSRGVQGLIFKFTSVILLKRQQSASGKEYFFSSSDGCYVGRTTLGNVEIASPEILIDSIVHEAIHSLLYMIDAKYQWQPSPAESDIIGNKILSPWSGNILSVRNYLQAIFVWYGLYNFWQFAVDKNIYDQEFAGKRLELIRNGFKQVDLAKISKEVHFTFDETLDETVSAIRSFVLKN